MCGIAGLLAHNRRDPRPIVKEMAAALSHRGPDGFGCWSDDKAGAAFGHSRLAILDLSSNGKQPMVSRSGRWVITFNGEIYNHREIRWKLQSEGAPCKFIGRSDTETLLNAIDVWGVEATLPLLNGMFAFAAWNTATRCLYLVRDRFGEKPLYYGKVGGDLVFGSELKALQQHPCWEGVIDRRALATFMRYNYIKAPETIFSGIKKLPPASYLIMSDHGLTEGVPKYYWQPQKHLKCSNSKSTVAPTALAATAEDLLKSAVESRMLSDVPIGAFLSGGYDSTAVVLFMQMLGGKVSALSLLEPRTVI